MALGAVKQHDPVHYPEHYCQAGIEHIDLVQSRLPQALIGHIFKYVYRYNRKGQPVEDLSKALQWVAFEEQRVLGGHKQVTVAEFLDANPQLNTLQALTVRLLFEYGESGDIECLRVVELLVKRLLKGEMKKAEHADAT